MDEPVRAFLDEPRFAVVATVNEDGTPQQSIVWYELQGDEIMMNTKRGRVKDRNLRRDPRVSFCLEDGYRYLTITGVTRLIDDQEVAQADIRHLAIRYHGEEKGSEMSRRGFQKEERVTIRMSIDELMPYGFEDRS